MLNTGDRFGRLVVVGEVTPPPNDYNKKWLVKCDCGNTRLVREWSIRKGGSTSCGCFANELRRLRKTNFKHGHVKQGKPSPEYVAWGHMRARCSRPNHSEFHNYGGRGISVCERWQEFGAFIADVGLRPSPKHSLDRIDNNGNYEPGNVRWATNKEQSRNTRRVKLYEHDGFIGTLADWSERVGINQGTLRARVNRSGWSFEDAISAAPNKGVTCYHRNRQPDRKWHTDRG